MNEIDSIIDSTKLTCFQTCERKFFFRHVLNWAPEQPSIHLEFGIAWHLAKEIILRKGYSPEVVDEAYQAFLQHYRLHFSPSDDQAHEPKTPARALEALQSYAELRRRSNKYKVHMTEVAGRVAITKDRSMVFKIDAVVEDEKGLWVLDHKTASRLSSTWVDSWQHSLQIGLYIHALRSYNSEESVAGAIIEGTIFRKKDHEHITIPIRKTHEAMQSWYWTVCQRLSFLDWNYEALNECSEDDEVLTAFPQNFGSCTDYGTRCPYFDLCLAWSNPLRHSKKPPIGFKVDVWNPLEEVEKARERWEIGA